MASQFDQQMGLGRTVAPTAAAAAPQVTSVNQALGRMGAPAPAAPTFGPTPPAAAPAGGIATSRALTGGAASAAPASTVAPTSIAKTAGGAVVKETAEEVVETGLRSRLAQFAPSLAGKAGKGSLLKGGAASVAGLMASGWIDQRNLGGENSELDQGLTGALMGGGLAGGAALALGLGTGPVGWAALGGAALFAAGNMIFGDNDSTEEKMDQAIGETNSTINELIANPMFGVDPQTASQIQLQVAATTAFYKDAGDLAGLNSYLQGLAQTVPSFLMEASSRNAANQQKMALQAQFGPVFSRMVDKSSLAAKQAMDVQMQAASAVQDPGTRAAMESNAANQYSAQMDTMTAYAQQIAGSAQNSNPAAQQVLTDTQGMMAQMMGG